MSCLPVGIKKTLNVLFKTTKYLLIEQVNLFVFPPITGYDFVKGSKNKTRRMQTVNQS